MRKTILVSIAFTLGAVFGSWGGVLKGKVSDPDGVAVDFASVRVLSASDSLLVRGETADANGLYSVGGLDEGKYIVQATCVGFQTLVLPVSLDSGGEAVLDFVLIPAAEILDGITVRADRFTRTVNGLTVIPGKEQTRHSTGGYDLVRSLMIPGVSVKADKGEVSALGGPVSLYIDGVPADSREVRQLRPTDVARIQYMDAPAGKYAGENVVLNFILKNRDSGGYVAIDGLQRAGYVSGDYNLAARFFCGNTRYTLYAGTEYEDTKGDGMSRDETIAFPAGEVRREYATDASRTKRESQYSQLRVRDRNDGRTLRATLSFVHNAVPTDYNAASLRYTGLHDGSLVSPSERESSSRAFKYSLGLSGSFKLPRNQLFEASASATATRSNYGYEYAEGSGNVSSATREDFFNFATSCTYVINFRRGNSLVFRADEYFNVSSAYYFGSDRSWQHLWSSETLCFAQYAHPLGGKASVRVAPGMSAQFYRLHGMEAVSYFGPRLQTTFVMQPMRDSYLQAVVLYGNSFPQLSMLTGAVRQVDLVQQRRGNPGLQVTRLLQGTMVYGIGIGKVSLQALGQFKWAGRLPVSEYSSDGDMLVETYASDGEWRGADVSVSATWTPCVSFNMQMSGGWLYNGYRKAADVGAACWKGGVQATLYAGDFAVSAHMESPRKIAGYNLVVERSPWLYGFGVSWSCGALKIEVGTDNPFSRCPVHRYIMSTPVYRFDKSVFSVTDRRSAYLKLAWSIDFGKNTGHDTSAVDRTIHSGILKAE